MKKLAMSEIIKENIVTEYNNMVGQETLHPLISVIDFSNVEPFEFKNAQSAHCLAHNRDRIADYSTYPPQIRTYRFTRNKYSFLWNS